jgi:hypothetical protein
MLPEVWTYPGPPPMIATRRVRGIALGIIERILRSKSRIRTMKWYMKNVHASVVIYELDVDDYKATGAKCMCNSKAQWRHTVIFPNVFPLMPLTIFFDKASLSFPIKFLDFI